ncbi:MAG: hypothetical protein HYT29_01770, partial [Parcubacteria group bacterium]|nr:hypothetical protein [Parcubacteria group bacterium]
HEGAPKIPQQEEKPPAEPEKKEPPVFRERDKEFLAMAADNFIDQAMPLQYDSFVFLDHSARYLASLIKARWKFRFPDEQIPEMKFVKVGREFTWRTDKGSYYYALDRRDTKKLSSEIQKKFTKPDGSSYFDGKKVLIVDDYMWTGGALNLTKNLFLLSFPKITKIDKAAFSTSPYHFEHNYVGGRIEKKGLSVHPLGYATEGRLSRNDRGVEAPIPPSVRDKDYLSAFIKPVRRETEDIKNKENPLWLKIFRSLAFKPVEKISSQSQERIEKLEGDAKKQAEHYRASLKEIEEIATTKKDSKYFVPNHRSE